MGTAPGGFIRRSLIDEGGPVRRPVPTILSGSLTDACLPEARRQVGGANVSASDSLDLSLLEIEIQKAEEQVSATSLLRRILPQIHLSASFGVHDLVFVDPATFVPYIIPKDAYRLTVSLSLNELLNSSRHAQASFELQKLKTEYVQRTLRQSQSRKTLEHQLLALQQELDKLDEEKTMIEQLLRFNELRFQQGKIEFDGLMRTKLELKSAEKGIQRLQSQKEQIRHKLSQGDFQ
jgi:outer membrane protein TolC